MKIADLALPVMAAKTVFRPHVNGAMTFSPDSDSRDAFERCRSKINRQAGNGYVLEYVIDHLPKPNPGCETRELYIDDKAKHRGIAGRLFALHRLHTATYGATRELIGDKLFDEIQDIWVKPGSSRSRWGVALPIVESFKIEGMPRARDVFTRDAYHRIFRRQERGLRSLNDDERRQLAGLLITPQATPNAAIGRSHNASVAERKWIDQQVESEIVSAIEGASAERLMKIRSRSSELVKLFIDQRVKTGRMKCDNCPFDPVVLIAGTTIEVRSMLDVHHGDPLARGVRETVIGDLHLLCPTCHRFLHRKADTLADPKAKAQALRPSSA